MSPTLIDDVYKKLFTFTIQTKLGLSTLLAAFCMVKEPSETAASFNGAVRCLMTICLADISNVIHDIYYEETSGIYLCGCSNKTGPQAANLNDCMHVFLLSSILVLGVLTTHIQSAHTLCKVYNIGSSYNIIILAYIAICEAYL